MRDASLRDEVAASAESALSTAICSDGSVWPHAIVPIADATSDELVADDATAALSLSKVPHHGLVNEHDGLGLTPTNRAIYRAAATRDNQLVLAPGSGHADVFRFPRVWRAFTAFLRRELH